MFRAKILVLGPCEVSFFDLKAFCLLRSFDIAHFYLLFGIRSNGRNGSILKFSLTTAVLLSLVLNISFSCHFAEW